MSTSAPHAQKSRFFSPRRLMLLAGVASLGAAVLFTAPGFVPQSALPGTAYAQSQAKPETPAAQPKAPAAPAAAPSAADKAAAIRERATAWHTQCMQDWDSATHMTKKEWERTCRRVTIERSKFLLDQANQK